MLKICLAGVGPGGEKYVLPVVREQVEAADVLLGGARATAPFLSLQKEIIPLTGKLEGLAERLRKLAALKKIVVLVSGDPGFYSLLAYLRRHFTAAELEVLPGVSSMQVAFARLAEPWQDATLLSAHGRNGEELLPSLLRPGKKAILTDQQWTPGRIAKMILGAGGSDTGVALCYRLTTPAEEIQRTRLSLLDAATAGDCVMVIEDA
ncbi:MAG TPA: precorrin-6y C5,15-methyltransferase (decarboxylating) subunit CbiE [Oscillospiraceae bacterium]|nr:precorrin-6y C5,15-methyltransferase (decarboxylating) subunit CbiE [Oscillospiraceae bacterium]